MILLTVLLGLMAFPNRRPYTWLHRPPAEDPPTASSGGVSFLSSSLPVLPLLVLAVLFSTLTCLRSLLLSHDGHSYGPYFRPMGSE
ncbi:hypothetical protein SKAU_G00010610 [Synaphobranchus kaupii]|uniref:Uncharacterized protein n=1 Tax=Synaphobranchus kaupii TaxID=118154 RepID=A0A9Q1GB25_SYNKA|nr:hypothetical protein SKAU_G00010610 [Synaphobranchus kaupii]